MSKPRKGFKRPEYSGQTKILFCNEGNPTAMLVTNAAGNRSSDPKRFNTPARALAWCRQHAVMMVYMPVNLAGN
jgi:hypothetical protein